MVAREEEVWGEVKSILSSDAELNYFKKVYEGWRDDVPIEVFPCIYLEPVTTSEEFYAMPMRYKLGFDLKIVGCINVTNYNKQIIGDATTKGIIDIANDIKSILSKYPNLNNKCQKFNFPSTNYIFEDFPIRRVEITMRIELITVSNVR